MNRFFVRLLEVPTTDPDDARRGKLLNILLFGVFVCAFLGLLLVVLYPAEAFTSGEVLWMVIICAVFMVGSAGLSMLNRKHGRAAAILFLFLLTAAFTFSDTPEYVLMGRSLFVFSIPIAISSLLIHPLASFAFSILVAVIMIVLAMINGLPVNSPAILGYMMLGLVSWLTARSLEQALRNLHRININLDQLVQERTDELAKALVRETIEAGRSKAILESIADGVIVFDPEGQATQANPALVRLLDLPEEVLLRVSVPDLANAAALGIEDKEILRTLLSGSEEHDVSQRIQWGTKTLSVNAASVTDDKGAQIGNVAVFRDYTREAEVERMKSNFLAMVSHELRTPLNAILGYVEMFKESLYGPINARQTRVSDRILSNVRHLLDIVTDLLDQTQIEAGKLTINKLPFKLSEMVENAYGAVEKLATDKGLMFTSTLEPNMPAMILGDQARLQQILVNLANNAIKFTERGSVRIRIFRSGQDQWGMEVADTGIGISEDEMPRIFEAFHQVDSTSSRRYGGFGLGLSIVKQLANLMGGEVTAQSSPGSGSVFTVIFPLIEVQRRPIVNELALVIEDDVDLADIFTEALQAANFKVETIRDGHAAQVRLRELTPQVIILDMHLPNVDGQELLRQIRTDPMSQGVIVVVATADARMGEAYTEIADFVLIKPISYTQLRDLAQRLHKDRAG